MRVYVAGKFQDKQTIKDAMLKLQLAGHEITYDWTLADASGLEGDEQFRYCRAQAAKDVLGVHSADALVMVWHPHMKGAFVEMGIAMAFAMPIIVVGAPMDDCVFFTLPQCIHVKDMAEAIQVLGDAERLIVV